MKKALVLVVAVLMLGIAFSASTHQVSGIYWSPFANIYGSPNWVPQWNDAKSAIINGTFVNMLHAWDPRFIGTSILTPWDQTVYSFGNLGLRMHFPLMISGTTIPQLTGNIEFKYGLDWGGVDWTLDWTTYDWVEDAFDRGWVGPSLELSFGKIFAKSGESFWGAWPYTVDTPAARAALAASVQDNWDNQTKLVATYRTRENASAPWEYYTITLRVIPQVAYGWLDEYGISPVEALVFYDGDILGLVEAFEKIGISQDGVFSLVIDRGLEYANWLLSVYNDYGTIYGAVIAKLSDKFGILPEDADALIDQYGIMLVGSAGIASESYDELMLNIMGYALEGTAGSFSKTISQDEIYFAFRATNLFDGSHTIPSPYVAVYKYNGEGKAVDIVLGGYDYQPFQFDATTEEYKLTMNISGLEPGDYVAYIVVRALYNDTFTPTTITFSVK